MFTCLSYSRSAQLSKTRRMPIDSCSARIVAPILGIAVFPNRFSAAGSHVAPVSPTAAGHLGLPRCLIQLLNFLPLVGTLTPLAVICCAGGMVKHGPTVLKNLVPRFRWPRDSASNNPHFLDLSRPKQKSAILWARLPKGAQSKWSMHGIPLLSM